MSVPKTIIPWRKAVTGVALALSFLFGSAITSHGQVLNEDQIKANYLLGFVDFVHWERSSKDPIVIGILGAPALEEKIAAAARSKAAKGAVRQFDVRAVTELEALAEIDVLFFGTGTESEWPRWIEAARPQGVLTVGEEAGFLEAGGLIEFIVVKNRLRFSLNLEESEGYRIGLSSKLARLAVE